MSPPERREPPAGNRGPNSVEANDKATIPPASAVVLEAESILLLEALARAAIVDLTTKQLRAMVWLGINDMGWRHVLAELDRRGVDL